jgi:putative salt-induced outer membrane protein
LQSVLEAQRWRLNWDTSLTALLVAKLSLSATFTLRFDNDPLPRVKHLDTLSSVNLVYRFF